MSITASEVVKLREATGLGMMTCKKALMETEGDMEKAIDNLRKQGQVTAAKRASKAAKEGKVEIIVTDTDALIYEVNSETDFVARNEDFLSFATKVGQILLENRPSHIEAARALTSPLFDGQSIEAKELEIVGKIGEKIAFRRFHVVPVDRAKERIFSYIHGNGKIGVLVTCAAERKDLLDTQSFADLGKDLAMQVAASKPIAVTRDHIPEAVIAKEKEIYLSQVQSSGKPEKIWDKIVDGKLNKYLNQVVLLEQQFIKDTDISVADRIHQVEKENGTTITVVSFTRFELGAED